MKTLAVFVVSFCMLFATLRLCAQTATPVDGPAGADAAPTAAADNTADAEKKKDAADAQTDDSTAAPAMDAQDIARKLLTTKRREAVVPADQQENSPQDARRGSPGAAPTELVKPIPDPPGAMIVNRLGRLRRSATGDGWQFHFESDKDVLFEAPLGVLPNRMLEAMENILEKAGERPTLFKITGELTSYRGQRFVLIRRMIVRRDTGAM